MIRWLAKGSGSAREEAVTLLPDHQLWVTPNGQVEGRELSEIIREIPRAKGTREELQRFVSDVISHKSPIVRSMSLLPAAPGVGKHPAVVVVQDDLNAGADVAKELADGQIVKEVRGSTAAEVLAAMQEVSGR